MSLVGTRPPTMDEWEKYELHHRKRLAIKPGLTGMWQVSGRSDITDFEEVVELRKIEDNEIEKMYSCYQAAYKRYEKADNFRSFESIKDEFLNRKNKNMFYYGAFELETNSLNLQFLPAFHRHILNMNFTYSGPGKHFLYIMTMRC